VVRNRYKRLRLNLSQAERHRCVQSDGAGHERTFETSKSMPGCSAGGKQSTEYQRAIGKDRCITSEGKAATSYFLPMNALSCGICHKVLSSVQH